MGRALNFILYCFYLYCKFMMKNIYIKMQKLLKYSFSKVAQVELSIISSISMLD